jgi:hypothetical protein
MRGLLETTPRRPVWVLTALAVLLSAPALGDRPASASSREVRNEEIVAFFSMPDDPLSGRVAGDLVAATSPDRRGYGEIVIRDASGTERSIAWRGARRRPYIRADRTYDIEVEHHAAPEPASSIVIRDGDGLLYAAFSDRTAAGILKQAVPGFRFEVTPDENGTEALG